MVLLGKDNNLFKHLVAHKELLGGTRDVSIAVLQSHSSETGLLNLKSNTSGQVQMDLRLLHWVDTCSSGGSENIKALVSHFVNHLYLISIK